VTYSVTLIVRDDQVMPELLDLLKQYGLPGWALLLIGGGTIVAAIISSVNAILVAIINAWAAKRVAIYTAHREYRKEACAPVLEWSRKAANFASQVRRERIRSHDELVYAVKEWMERRAALGTPGTFFLPEGPVYNAWSFSWRRYVELGGTIRLGTSGDEESAAVKIQKVREAASLVMSGNAMVENAVEGHVYDLFMSRQSVRTRLLFYRFGFFARRWQSKMLQFRANQIRKGDAPTLPSETGPAL
jgi:hypothetical protein